MTILTTLILPAQPVTGLVSLIDLGGDGHHSPRYVQQFRVVGEGDVSGGENIITVQLDQNYTALVNYLAVASSSALAQAARFSVRPGPGGQDDVDANVTATDLGIGITMTAGWIPPPLVLQSKDNPLNENLPAVAFTVANTDAEDWTFKGSLYIFDKTAVFEHPVEMLLAPLIRGSMTF